MKPRKRYAFLLGLILGVLLTIISVAFKVHTESTSCANTFNVLECKNIWVPVFIPMQNGVQTYGNGQTSG